MDYDILKVEDNSITIKAEANAIVSHKKSTIQKNGFRRFENNLVIQTSSLGEVSLDQLIHQSREYDGMGTKHDFGFAEGKKDHKYGKQIDDKCLSSFTEGLNYLSKKYSDFIFSGECVVSNKYASLKSSYGLDLSTSGGLIDWYFLYQRKGSGNMLDGYFFGLNDSDNIMASIKNQEKFINASFKTSKIDSGKYPVLFIDEKPTIKKLLESFQVNKYKENASLYNGQLDQKLFDTKVNIFDSGYDPSSGNYMFFDGEGTIREEDLYLIKNGKFNSLISDLRNQAKFNVSSTGNGSRIYNRGVSLDFKGVRIKKGNSTWNNIIKNIPICIIAFVAAGGDSNDFGEYSTPVQVGYIFKYGELDGLAPQITVKTSIDNYLGKNLIDISSDGFVEDMPSGCIISEMEVLVN
ncbi:MAG: hypothetical protein KDD45_03125 [Bdellovibrionales bacterium]|nr:hypothetical protein [Bdellovibrionales bacterium]